MADKLDKNEQILTRGIDFDRRRIYWGSVDGEERSDFKWLTVEQVIRALRTMYDLGSGPIELHMSSDGGDAHEMLRLVDEIEAAPVQIRFIGGGQIMSCATWIMAVCDHRSLHKNTTVMVHDGTEEEASKHTDFKISAESSALLQDRLDGIFAENSRMPKYFWREVLQRDLYLSAEETVRLGLADEVIPARKRGNLRKARIAKLKEQPSKTEMEKLVKTLYKRIKRSTVPNIVVHAPKEQFDANLQVGALEAVSESTSELTSTNATDEHSPDEKSRVLKS